MADEFELIDRYFAPLARGAPGAWGLRDDAAVLALEPGKELVVTTDAVVAGVHFLADEAPRWIAAKIAGCNLSDLAAMGATPLGFTLACAWPEGTGDADIAAFADGLGPWVADYAFPLLGGDTVTTPGPATFSLTALGRVPAGRALRRSGARAGERVFVTGSIGDGALGLMAARGELPGLDADAGAELIDRYRRPRPRIGAGRALIGRATAAIDVSDGLVQDLGHIARTSGVDIEIEAARVPLSAPARAALAAEPALLATILGGGDDYELAFTARETPQDLGVAVSDIGRVVAGDGRVRVRDAAGDALDLAHTGYRHFE